MRRAAGAEAFQGKTDGQRGGGAFERGPGEAWDWTTGATQG